MKRIKISIGLLMLFIWLIINTIYLIKKIRNLLKETNKDLELVVKCEKCKNEHTATIDELLDTFMVKTQNGFTKSARLGPF